MKEMKKLYYIKLKNNFLDNAKRENYNKYKTRKEIIDRLTRIKKPMQQDDKEEKSKRAYYIRIIKGTRQDENKYRFVKLPDNFLRGEKGQKLQSCSQIAWYLFFEMVYDMNVTNGKITAKDCDLFEKIYNNTEKNVGRKINQKEFINAMNILVSFGLVRRVKDTIEIKNYEQYYI